MKRLLAILAFGLCVALVNAQDDKKDDAKKDDAKKELERFQGTWKTESIEVRGVKKTSAEFGESLLVIKDDKYTFTMPDEIEVMGRKQKIIAKEEGSLKLDATKKPWTIDLVITEGEAKGKTQLGVYELDGDTFKVTVSDPGDQSRPKDVGKGDYTFVFKKEKK